MDKVDALIAEKCPNMASQSDMWFAWYPVRTGPLGSGSVVWLRKVWRNRCCGVTVYQEPPIISIAVDTDFIALVSAWCCFIVLSLVFAYILGIGALRLFV